jgi:hypothetical protein
MHYDVIPKINQDIKRTKKAVVGLGCSFVEGHGAIDQWLWDTYHNPKPYEHKSGIPFDYNSWELEEKDIKIVTEKYPDIERRLAGSGSFKFINHENNNSFTSVLAKKYFNGEYAAINLGRRGNGNRATIKDLYYYPDVLWDEVEEFIVIFCPSGLERYDFIDDTAHTVNNHNRWVTMWPTSHNAGPPISNLWEAYRDSIWSDKFEVLEAIANIQELLTWCKWKKAKLVIVPAFMRYYNRNDFVKRVNQTIVKDSNLKFSRRTINNVLNKEVFQTVDMWPWDKMFYPDGYPTFADLCMAQEKSLDWKDGPNFYSYLGYGTPDKWITPCGHPSTKGHDLLAKLLYQHITGNL